MTFRIELINKNFKDKTSDTCECHLLIETKSDLSVFKLAVIQDEEQLLKLACVK